MKYEDLWRHVSQNDYTPSFHPGQKLIWVDPQSGEKYTALVLSIFANFYAMQDSMGHSLRDSWWDNLTRRPKVTKEKGHWYHLLIQDGGSVCVDEINLGEMNIP